jgi:hypothetical protein
MILAGFALSACVTCTSAYAEPHGRPAASTQHLQAPHTTGKPTTTGTPTTTTTTTHLNPIAAKISSKPQLDAKITAMLPKGMTLNQASKGFKNQGQFIAALHVSQNLGCDCFKQLQTDMNKKHMSLGQAIQDVRKTANATVEAHTAETEANDDVKSTTTTTSTATTKNATKKTTHSGSDHS